MPKVINLTTKQREIMVKLTANVEPSWPQLYLEDARQHLREAEFSAPRKPNLNLELCRVIFSTFEEVVVRWDTLSVEAQIYLCGAMKYFTSYNDAIHDFNTVDGFKDDLAVVNACLDFAGLEELKVNSRTRRPG